MAAIELPAPEYRSSADAMLRITATALALLSPVAAFNLAAAPLRSSVSARSADLKMEQLWVSVDAPATITLTPKQLAAFPAGGATRSIGARGGGSAAAADDGIYGADWSSNWCVPTARP